MRSRHLTRKVTYRKRWIEDTPVIMISSENSAAYIRKAYDMGVSDFISRPFDANVVIRRVYKEGYSHEKTMEMILNGECGNFNPILFECLKDIQSEIPDEVYGGGVKT